MEKTIKIIKTFTDDEIKDIKNFVECLEIEKETDWVESNFLGVKRGDKTDNIVYYDIYRNVGIVEVKRGK
jgi:hypothetical protein